MNELLTYGPTGWADELIAGTIVTLFLGVLSFALGLLLGVAGALAKLNHAAPIRWAAEVYTTLARGFPELVIIYIFFFGGGQYFYWVANTFGFGRGTSGDAFLAGVCCLGFISGSYATEVIRGAILAIPIGQFEAADSFGLSRSQKLVEIGLPQMLRFALPGLSNVWLLVLKDTAFISVMGLEELMRVSHLAAGSSHKPFLFYTVAIIAYLVLSAVSVRLFDKAEQVFGRGTKRASL